MQKDFLLFSSIYDIYYASFFLKFHMHTHFIPIEKLTISFLFSSEIIILFHHYFQWDLELRLPELQFKLANIAVKLFRRIFFILFFYCLGFFLFVCFVVFFSPFLFRFVFDWFVAFLFVFILFGKRVYMMSCKLYFSAELNYKCKQKVTYNYLILHVELLRFT